MAILKNVISNVDDIKPNAFSNASKTAWLNEVEGYVQTEIMMLALADVVQYEYESDKDAVLMVEPPHDKIYWTYLTAMIDFANGEYNKYNNTMQLYNTYIGEYTRWYAARFRPADGKHGMEGYYISAYGIAVKHGYVGTEEDWLRSLKGERGAGFVVKGYYPTLADLEETITDPEQGDTYAVGTVPPYTMYMWDEVEGWVNNGCLKGEKGDQGETGPAGRDGIDGAKGDKGDRGETGPAGRDGVDGRDGTDGQDGQDGQDGRDGYSGVYVGDGTPTENANVWINPTEEPVEYPIVDDLNLTGTLLQLRCDGVPVGVGVTLPGGGTVTGAKVNGQSITPDGQGVLQLGTLIREHQDISGKLNTSLKGSANGLAELDSNGHVPSSQLPGFVDDVLEYASISAFPTTGETGKIYVALNTNKCYRWGGTEYVLISSSLALGTTSSTAYRGDRGETAYNHSQVTGNPHNTTFASLLSKPTTLAGYGITDAEASGAVSDHNSSASAHSSLFGAKVNLSNLTHETWVCGIEGTSTEVEKEMVQWVE